MPKISVIIPVYNVSDYLDKCLWSMTNQTFRDLEIIVVNDGSTDNSLSIIENYATMDNRIKVVTKKNEGVVYARKAGLEIATGSYIHYLDGDDHIELNCYELLYKKAIETDADMIIMEFLFDDNCKPINHNFTEPFSNIDFLKLCWGTDRYNNLVLHLHKKSLYQNQLSFCKELTIGEDLYLTSQLAYYSKKIVFLNIALYHYITRGSSAMNVAINEKKASNYRLYPVLLDQFMATKKEYESLKQYLTRVSIVSDIIVMEEGYFNDCHARSMGTMKKIAQYPVLKKDKKIKSFIKLIRFYSISTFTGALFAKYYRRKKKIK